MQIPESIGLFIHPIAAKPGELIITGVVKTPHPAGYGIIKLFTDNEFFHGHTVKEQIRKGIGSINAIIPLAHFFLIFGLVAVILRVLAGNQKAANHGKAVYDLFHG
jgi:hypothetical protein